jgi:hypothetical protein
LASYTADVPPSPTSRARGRQWRDILAFALAQREAISVGCGYLGACAGVLTPHRRRSAIIDYLRRTPTRAEITATRRAAHRLAASGQATILRVKPSGVDAVRGSAHLILARPGAATQSESLDQLADISIADKASQRFEPTAMAKDLATSVELLSAAIEAIPADRLHRTDAEQLADGQETWLALQLLRLVSR